MAIDQITVSKNIQNAYKQLGSGLRPQICLYVQGFRCSKLPYACLVV